jgi:ribosomal protein S27E
MSDDRVLSALRGHDSELAQAAAALSAAGGADAWALPVGAADRRLLALHREVTGRDLDVTVDCPDCGARSTATLGPDTVPPWEPRSLWWGPGRGLREPVLADLAGLPETDPAGALLQRCAVGTLPDGTGPEALAQVDTALAGPLVVTCAGCGTEVAAPVDVEPLVLRALFRRLDAIDVEIHLLASAYRWDLATIEALPGDRRTRFATLVAEGR